MARRRRVDASKLIEAVESGRLKKDVMDQFGVEARPPKSSASGRRRGRRAVVADWSPVFDVEIRITKRGSLVLPRTLMQELGYEEGDAFLARKTRVGINLRKI